jgi:hypothetical protein
METSQWLGTTEQNSTTNTKTINTTAMVVSLLLRRIGDIATVVRNVGHNFRRLLLSVAYPLLEKLSDPHPVVSQSAHSTLVCVSECCSYGNVTSMLEDNMDYLVDAVCSKLRLVGQRNGTARVVRSIVSETTTTSALLEEVVQTLLSSLNQEFVERGDDSALEWIEVCREICASLCHSSMSMMHWAPNAESALTFIQQREANEQDQDRKRRKNNETEFKIHNDIEPELQSLVSTMFQDQCDMARMMDLDVSVPDQEEEEKKEKEEKKVGGDKEQEEKTLTPEEKTTDAILRRCVHYRSSPSLNVRVSTLATLNTGMRVLANNERSLLPLVATMFPSIRNSIRSPNVVVSTAGLGCLCTISILASDFVRARFAREVWPTLKKVLVREVKNARRKVVGERDLRSISGTISSSSPTPNFNPMSTFDRGERSERVAGKYLCCVLTTLCVLSSGGMLRSEHVLDVSLVATRFLSTEVKVGTNIRKLALTTLERMYDISQSLVWHCFSVVFGISLNHVSGDFLDCQIAGEYGRESLWEGAKIMLQRL